VNVDTMLPLIPRFPWGLSPYEASIEGDSAPGTPGEKVRMEGEIQDESGEDRDPLVEVVGATLESIRRSTATGECWRGWLYRFAKQFRRGLT
jgi:hypothetical protein